MNEFKDKVVVITGGCLGIGRQVAKMFQQEGAHVCIMDVQDNDYFQGDAGKKEDLEAFVDKVLSAYGSIDYLINNAKPVMKGIDECSYEEFMYALQVGVSAPFMLSKLFKDHFRKGGCIINISSTRAFMSQAQTESYSAAKGGIAALTHSLAMSLAGKVRVNSISPGWIDTNDEIYFGPDALQHPVQRVGTTYDIGHMVLFLCSEKAGFITGQDFCVDGGMSKQMIYHDDHGWNYKP
ncbi:SDR family oxidoreductase [[Clostridium] spiroforme]|nr:SDR family oxidoreductase [Thomasclavelia spiroformis]